MSRGSILLGAWWHSVVHSACVEAESTSQSIPLRLALFHGCGKTRREAGAGAHRLVGQAPDRSGQAEQGQSPKHRYPGMWSCKAQSNMVMISLGNGCYCHGQLSVDALKKPLFFPAAFRPVPVILFLRAQEFPSVGYSLRMFVLHSARRCFNMSSSSCGCSRALSALMAPSWALCCPLGIRALELGCSTGVCVDICCKDNAICLPSWLFFLGCHSF